MKVLRLKSPAKLNLYLKVLNKRPDGYHNIITLFERIGLYDDIILKARHRGIKIACKDPLVPKTRKNLAHKAAAALLDYAKAGYGVRIEIVKRIPVGAGLGGGSSNAASALLGLNRLWGLNLSLKVLMLIGRKIGADVNFFLLNRSVAVAEGIGDILRPVNLKSRIWHVLVCPNYQGPSTKDVYEEWDNQLRAARFNKAGKIRLTALKRDVKILTQAVKKQDLPALSRYMSNDLESAASYYNNNIIKIKNLLLSYKMRGVLMSGSGPTIFATTTRRKEAAEAKKRLDSLKGSWRTFLAKAF